MVQGRTPDNLIVKWFPGESHGDDGTGADVILANTLPSSQDDAINEAASGIRAYFDARFDALEARLVASGVFPV